MSEEYKRAGIRVNAILSSAIVPAERYAEAPHLGVTPEQFGKLIAFLASVDGEILQGAHIPAYGAKF